MRRRLSLLLLTLCCTAAYADDPTYWAFRKPVRVDPPQVSDPHWVQNSIDAFVLAKLDKAGLKPSPPASKAALLRRVTCDLIGLPPTPKEIDDFLGDDRPDAYERVVDRLLASPHFGERQAQHWLDVVRYAESNGYESDGERPNAWRYRDYVVRSFNEDKPYDRFLTEQLAGDLTASSVANASGSSEDAERLIAAGFNRCGPVHQTSGNVDQAVLRQELLTEMTNGAGAAFLGLTVGCARCHDHKFDPIPQADYYRLQAFFSAAHPKEIDLSTPAEREENQRQNEALNAKIGPLRKEAADIEAPVRDRLREAKRAKLEAPYRDALAVPVDKRTPEQKKLAEQADVLIKVTWDEIVDALPPADRERRAELRRQANELEAQRPAPLAQAWTIAEDGSPRFSYVLKRGVLSQKGTRVEPGFLGVLQNPGADAPGSPGATLSRLDLAKWLTRPDHPLTARVIVNRLWEHHFGRGIVATPDDFGVHGDSPTHPELLDWLAVELVEHGWSLKHVHRLMVLSNAYRQDSRPGDADGKRIDPENHLLWRMNRRRLDAEALRDGVLATAGTLNPAVGGPMVRTPLEPEVYDRLFSESEPDNLWLVTPDPRQHTRRSLYLFSKRNLHLPLLEVFDQPDTLSPCPVRAVSTFAPQALVLLNGPFLHEQSKAFAVRLLREANSDGARVDLAYRLALGRTPRDEERRTALDFLAAQTELLRDRLRARLPVGVPADAPADVDPAAAAALADFCLAMLNRNEFLYVP
ncbi:MAG TPA: DUF1549 and DUF1553 domain-containing protein [Gemmataceae bacterium]|nr:DUF1549 and DUF1553 domain-containing protein [Gemmataceae bacterium]